MSTVSLLSSIGECKVTNKTKIYLRRNGSFGASYGSVLDTGHCIHEDSGKFTVWSIDGSGHMIADNLPKEEAERAIAYDWKIS